jgi:hypothetical protein
VAHIVGARGLFHLYLTGIDEKSLLVSGYESSLVSKLADGHRLYDLGALITLFDSVTPASDPSAVFYIDEGFEPRYINEVCDVVWGDARGDEAFEPRYVEDILDVPWDDDPGTEEG